MEPTSLIIFLLILILIAVSRRSSAGPSKYGRLVGTILLILVLPAAAGYTLDWLAGTLPLFLLLGLVVGIIGGMVYLFRTLGKLNR